MKPRAPCAMCERSRFNGYEQQAAAGKVRCTGLENDGQPELFVPYDETPPCPLFNLERDPARRAQRERFLAGQQAKQQQMEAA